MLAGVILSGGQSSRMGTDKSLLTLPDSQQTLLAHCQQNLALVCSQVFISGAQHAQGMADIIPNCGPLSGIHAAISHIEKHHTNISELLVVAVDMPALHPDDFNLLVKTGQKSHQLCVFENCFLPLYIPLSTQVTEYLDRVLTPQSSHSGMQPKQRQYSIKKMLDSLQGLQIQALKNTQLDNINTPLQWQQHCTEHSNPKQPITR